MKDTEVYICAAARTPLGKFRGAFETVSAVKLGATAILSSLERANLDFAQVGECKMGCVLQAGLGQAPARQAWLGAGGNDHVPSTTHNRVCGSGMQAIVEASRAILLGEYDVAVAGGMENMSRAAYSLPNARSGYGLGAPSTGIIDLLIHDGLWDPYSDTHMGNICEHISKKYRISREIQDDFAVQSYQRAQAATEQGIFASEIAPVVVPGRKGDVTVFQDESPQLFNEGKLRALRPAFDSRHGTITAGNASSINDGAAAMVVASKNGCREHGLTPIAKIAGWGSVATKPSDFPLAPVHAIQQLLKKAGLGVDDIDCFEINEAFAVVPILTMKQLGMRNDKVNLLGGAVALGHPIGASGARIVTTLITSLQHMGKSRGIAALCIGGGEGIALHVELVDGLKH